MDSKTVEMVILISSAIGALLVTTVGATWFLFNQFRKMRSAFYDALAGLSNHITAQLSDHERDDTRRFDALTKHLHRVEMNGVRRDRGGSRRDAPDQAD